MLLVRDPDRFRKRREKAGLALEALGTASRRSRSFIWLVETGQCTVHEEDAAAMAKAMGSSVGYLFKQAPKPEPKPHRTVVQEAS